jgi:hypothetical protein
VASSSATSFIVRNRAAMAERYREWLRLPVVACSTV